ncbi:MAG: hypothetical protein ACREMY_26515, partial [bacterium]
GSHVSVVTRLEEVKSMLAERVKEWPQQWKQEGRKEGRREGRREGRKEEREAALTQLRLVLIRELESRFGPLPLEARRSVESFDSYEKISELMIAAATAPTLTALGLCWAKGSRTVCRGPVASLDGAFCSENVG